MTTTKPELLAPAGSPEALDAAVGEGADAVYLGLKDFNARMRSANFTYSQFEGALRSLHRMGRKLYVTVNTVFEQREADRVYQLLKYLAGLGPDAIIVQDFGIVAMVRENFPSLKIFASTQMNVASSRGVNLLSRFGVSRVILSRELSLEEIQGIRANTNVELEFFVHGALCMSVSGICLFSSYLGGKSANRGMCTQACRRYYTACRGKSFENVEGEGGYFFSPSDLQLIEKIPDLVEAGVNSFKIEGRMKSAEYVGTVVSAYRLVIDNLESGEEILNQKIAEAKTLLKNDFARSKTVYLFNGPQDTSHDWLNPKQSGGTGISLGKLLQVTSSRSQDQEKESRGLVKTGDMVLSLGDSIRLHKADDSDRISHKLTFVEDRPGGCWISIPEGFSEGDAVYLIQTKAMTKRYAPVIPRKLEGFNRVPGRDRAPAPDTAKSKSGPGTDLPAGFYAMVSRIEDLYVLQSSRPVKAILVYSRKIKKQLLADREPSSALSRKQGLPFPARDIILSLDPFFPQEREAELAEDIPALIEKGYRNFIVNNLGHFSLFRSGGSGTAKAGKKEKEKPVLIAGPWLYTFNAWAWSTISSCGVEYCVSPLENNRQNLERSFPRQEYSRLFITIYTRPSLFRIRADLGKICGFENFLGNRDEAFSMAGGPEGTLVYPREPFSIVDKTPFLREAGFSRFILDFSSGPLKKAEYRDIMEAAGRAVPLPGVSRFNWKNGFFREPA